MEKILFASEVAAPAGARTLDRRYIRPMRYQLRHGSINWQMQLLEWSLINQVSSLNETY